MPRCKYCSEKYTPARLMQPGSVCNSVECQSKHALQVLDKQRKTKAKAEAIEAREDRKTIRIRKEAIKTRSDWIKEAQVACNAYVRERDKHKGCISCGASLEGEEVGGGFDAGHYRSRGSAPSLRFDERNIHGQCKRCNRYLSGNYGEFRIGLLRRFGSDFVSAIEADQSVRKFDIEELKAIKAKYVAKLKEMKK